MKAFVAAALIVLSGCSSLNEIVQGSIDQYAAGQDARPEVGAVFALPLAGFGTPELAESLQDIGRAIAHRSRPFAQIELTIANSSEAGFALGQIEKGIQSTGWTPAALVYPHRIIVDPVSRPFVRVIDGLPPISVHDRELMIKASRQARPL
jgi:hypothetical protein